MADNLAVTPGSGATIATDEVTWPPGGGTVHVPLGKLVVGDNNAIETISRGQQTMANSLPVAIASDQIATAALGDNVANPTTLLTGAMVMVWDGTNWDRVQTGASDGAGSANKVPATLFAFNGTNFDRVRGDTTGLYVSPRANATGGSTGYKLISAASTNATSVKGSAGTVYMITAFNTNAAARFLKLYNKASAPTVGTDTPLLTLAIPGNTAGAGFTLNVPVGINFGTGIALALTTGIADSNTGAVAADEIVVNLAYQ
jgi:hypothetical protein